MYGGAYTCILQVPSERNHPPLSFAYDFYSCPFLTLMPRSSVTFAPLIQVVVARTSDPEQNYFSDEFDGEGLNIDEVRRQPFLSFRYTFHLPLVLVFVLHLVPLLSSSVLARKFI